MLTNCTIGAWKTIPKGAKSDTKLDHNYWRNWTVSLFFMRKEVTLHLSVSSVFLKETPKVVKGNFYVALPLSYRSHGPLTGFEPATYGSLCEVTLYWRVSPYFTKLLNNKREAPKNVTGYFCALPTELPAHRRFRKTVCGQGWIRTSDLIVSSEVTHHWSVPPVRFSKNQHLKT